MKRLLLLFIILVSITGCRGWRSEKPPVHLNPNLDFQASIKAQEEPYPLPENTIPWGKEESFHKPETRDVFIKHKNPKFYLGKKKTGEWSNEIPIEINYESLQRGQQRFNIYCSMCHGKDGSGNGIVMEYGWYKPRPYWADHIVSYTEGELFNIITNGYNTMSGYGTQIKEEDRWAIVAYIRALQASNLMPVNEVPNELKNQLNN